MFGSVFLGVFGCLECVFWGLGWVLVSGSVIVVVLLGFGLCVALGFACCCFWGPWVLGVGLVCVG